MLVMSFVAKEEIDSIRDYADHLKASGDSFPFAEETYEQYSTLSMGRLYVNSLFTNIPLDERF